MANRLVLDASGCGVGWELVLWPKESRIALLFAIEQSISGCERGIPLVLVPVVDEKLLLDRIGRLAMNASHRFGLSNGTAV